MTTREKIITQLDTLPDSVLEKIAEFISFQIYSLDLNGDSTDYLTSIPGMVESIKKGMETPLSDCVPLSEVWPDV